MGLCVSASNSMDPIIMDGKIHLVRHAQSTYNAACWGKGGYIGNPNKDPKLMDAELTEHGIS